MALGKRGVTLCSGWALLLAFVISTAVIGGIPLGARLFQIAYGVGFLGYVLIVLTVLRATDERQLGAWRWWLLGALVVRLIPTATLPSDDVYRYAWEGRVQQAGFSPYRLAPDAAELTPLRTDDWDKINHPSFPAIYPPLAQLQFRLLAAVTPSVWLAKTVQVLWDFLTVVLLGAVLRRRGLFPHLSVVYGLCPLVLTAFAVEGHNDSLMLLLTLAAVGAIERRHWWWAGAALGSAVAAKTIAVVLLPWFLFRQRRAALVGVVVALMWYVPFGVDGFMGLANLRRFGEMSEFFSFLGSLWILNMNSDVGRLVGVGILAITVGLATLRCRRLEQCAAFSLAGVVLTLPVVHYLYITWVLLFVPFSFRWSWVIASGAMVLYFQAGVVAAHSGDWTMPAWVSVIVWLIFLSGWLVGLLCRADRRDALCAESVNEG